MERALQFLRNHKDVALATSEDNIPKLRIFQAMKQEGNVLYFATSEAKAVWRELRKNPNEWPSVQQNSIRTLSEVILNSYRSHIELISKSVGNKMREERIGS